MTTHDLIARQQFRAVFQQMASALVSSGDAENLTDADLLVAQALWEKVETLKRERDEAVAWIDVADRFPAIEHDEFYGDEHSEPVVVMVVRDGEVKRSNVTWRYSFGEHGWVFATLSEGLSPEQYAEYGRVTHWAPLPAAISTLTNKTSG